MVAGGAYKFKFGGLVPSEEDEPAVGVQSDASDKVLPKREHVVQTRAAHRVGWIFAGVAEIGLERLVDCCCVDGKGEIRSHAPSCLTDRA